MSAEKLKLYNEWVSRVLKSGTELAEYECPHCQFLMHAHIPDGDRVYDTLTTCPNCGQMHFKVVESDASVYVRKEAGEPLQLASQGETAHG